MDGTMIKIARTTEECTDLINELKSYNPKIVGLDCEWSENKVSLLQIGHPNLTILVRLRLIKTIPLNLIDFLRDVTILKCGVGIFEDVNKLKGHWNIDVFGCVDINNIFKTLLPKNKIDELFKNNENITNQTTLSLKSMSLLLLEKPMKYKLFAQNYTFHQNWDNNKLNKKQIFYAADDALKGCQIFITLMSLIENKNNKSYLEICYKYIDIKKIKNDKSNKINKKQQNQKLNINNAKNIKNKADALPYDKCLICGMNTNDLIMFSIIPEQYKPFILPLYDNNKYRIPLCLANCFKKCKNNQNSLINQIHQKHNFVMTPKKKLLTSAKIAAISLSDNQIKYKIYPNLRIKMLNDICDCFNLKCDVIYEEKSVKDVEYKWQYYDDNKIDNFVDYDETTSILIEKHYVQNKKKLLISNLKAYKAENELVCDGIYYIFCENSGLFWDVIGNGKKDGVHIHQWRFHGLKNQMFKLILCDSENGYYYIQCINSGKYLCIENGILVQYDKDKNRNQQFKMIKFDKNGLFNIINVNTNKALEIDRCSINKMAKVVGGDVDEKASDNQKFRLYCCSDHENKRDNEEIEMTQINFNKMEAIKYKNIKRIRRLYKEDMISNISFDNFIKIHFNKCLIGLSTNYLVRFCIQELINNDYKNTGALQAERWMNCKRNVVETYQNKGMDFKKIWIDSIKVKIRVKKEI